MPEVRQDLSPDGVLRPDLRLLPLTVGELRVTVLHDGAFRLDGGAMFGVVPRTMWERRTPPDARNRVQMTMRPALVEGPWGHLLIDCGAGDRWTDRERDIYAFERHGGLEAALGGIGLTLADITLVVPTHLHFDHIGGATRTGASGVEPVFPSARHLIRRAEWHDATHPHERNRASYRSDDFEPLLQAGLVDFFDEDHDVRPGVRVMRTGGHTGQHQVVFIESEGATVLFAADLLPTTAHVDAAWIMGYDLYPVETLTVKRQLVRQAIDGDWIVIFEHDPQVAAGRIRERNGRPVVEPLRYTS